MAKPFRSLTFCAQGPTGPRQPAGLTLVEMLIAMAITLVMMAAVVTVFANVSDSVRNRRAAIEMNSQVRHVREALQQDLAAATCPGQPWQRPESNHGYIELIEGPQSDFDPSIWLRDNDNDGRPDDIDGNGPTNPLPALDLTASTLPSSNQGRLPGSNTVTFNPDPSRPITTTPTLADAVTDGRGLGDWDDVLAFTARNESEPFVGRVPERTSVGAGAAPANFAAWTHTTIESQLAEVVWFAVENPVETDGNQTFYFGEPGFRTIYRRALLIAPQLNYAFQINAGGVTRVTGPGVVRVLRGSVDRADVDEALGSLVAFQERYDLSVRLEWDPQLDTNPNDGRWTIVANSLADLTKRENRYEHHGYLRTSPAAGSDRIFPYTAASLGGYPTGVHDLEVVLDPELIEDTRVFNDPAEFEYDVANPNNATETTTYRHRESATQPPLRTLRYPERPFVYVDQPDPNALSTPRAILNEDGQIVAITNGYVPLGGARRGQDIMLTDVLAFDMRVYDPEAPILAELTDSDDDNYPGVAVEPGDAGWGRLVRAGDTRDNSSSEPGDVTGPNRPDILGRGAYVDLGYWFKHYAFHEATTATNDDLADLNDTNLDSVIRSDIENRLLNRSALSVNPHVKSQMLRFDSSSFTPFRVYDTWSFHYENNGENEDEALDNDIGFSGFTDEGTNGFDNDDYYDDNANGVIDPGEVAQRLGPDDVGERETSPPYNTPLRGVQVTLRTYERDSRQIREVKVRQSFVPQ